MSENEEIAALLTEIRDVEREHLEEYRNVTQRSLELQQTAVSRQEQIARVYRKVLVVSGVLVVVILAIVIYLISYLPPRYR